MSDELSLGKRLGVNIAACRKALGLTQDYVAQRLGVEIETISRIERGVTLPSLKTLTALAQELSTSAQDLLGDEPSIAQEADLEGVAIMLRKLNEDDRLYVIDTTKALCKHLLGSR